MNRSRLSNALAAAVLATGAIGGCIHVLENGLTGKPQAGETTPGFENPPEPPRSAPPNDAIWRDPNVQIAIFGAIVAVANHFSKKSTAKMGKGA